MTKENISIVVLGVISILGMVLNYSLQTDKNEELLKKALEQTRQELDLEGLAKILEATKQPQMPAVINRVNSDDIKDSNEAKRQGDDNRSEEQCCENKIEERLPEEYK